MKVWVILILFFLTKTSCAQYTDQNNCRSYIGVKVVFEIHEEKIDWAEIRRKNPGVVCIVTGDPFSYTLKPLDSSFQIISFMLSSETSDDDIIEVPCEGNILTTRARIAYNMTPPGKDVNFYCIRAKHISGGVFTLQPFAIKRK
jgi:hypothetical protein